MSQGKITVLLCSILAMLLIVIGCRRYFSQPPADDSVLQARKWFHKKYDVKLGIKKDGSLANGNKYPDWRNVRTYASKYFTVIEAPLIEDVRKAWYFKDEGPRAGNAFGSIRKLLICERNDNYRETIMTIIARKKYLDASPDLSIVSLDQVPSDFSGIIYYETFNGDYLKGFVYKDGKISKGIKPAVFSSSPQSKTTLEFVITEIVIANCWTYVNHYNGSTDELVSTSGSYDESTCSIQNFQEEMTDCGSGSNPFCLCIGESVDWESCGFGAIGGSSNAPFNSMAAVPVITTSLLQDSFPCLDALIKDSISKVWTYNANAFAQWMLRNVFYTEQYMHLTYSVDYNLGQGNAAARAGSHATSWIDDNDHFHFQDTIFFNPYYMTHGTKEFKVATILHESIHVFVDYTFKQYGRFEIDSNEVKNRFPMHWEYFIGRIPPPANIQHEAMADKYRDHVSYIVAQLYNKSAPAWLRDSCSNSLAWGGLMKTSQWYASNADTCNIKAINVTAENALNGPSFSIGGNCRTYALKYSDSLKLTAPCK